MQQQREGTAGRYLTGGPDIEQGYRLLIFLATSPEFERKGIGSKLLKQGLQEAEEDAVPVYLGATPAGRPLYERNGFELMGTDSKGEPGVCTWEEAVMRWQPSEKVGVA
jgi:GNAT superfamily N-acetyltransferase